MHVRPKTAQEFGCQRRQTPAVVCLSFVQLFRESQTKTKHLLSISSGSHVVRSDYTS